MGERSGGRGDLDFDSSSVLDSVLSEVADVVPDAVDCSTVPLDLTLLPLTPSFNLTSPLESSLSGQSRESTGGSDLIRGSIQFAFLSFLTSIAQHIPMSAATHVPFATECSICGGTNVCVTLVKV